MWSGSSSISPYPPVFGFVQDQGHGGPPVEQAARRGRAVRMIGMQYVDFLPVLKHRDSGIGVVPVVRVSLTVASSRRGEMESYTVSARV